MNLNVKKGDNVLILAGKDKGKTGKIISANPGSGKVVVDNLNIITKHVKPRGANSPGGINKVPGPIDVSNVQLICAKCDKAVRISHKEIEGKNTRVCPKCGANLDEKKVEKKVKKAAKEKVEKTETAEGATEKKTVKKTRKPKTEKAAETTAEN